MKSCMLRYAPVVQALAWGCVWAQRAPHHGHDSVHAHAWTMAGRCSCRVSWRQSSRASMGSGLRHLLQEAVTHGSFLRPRWRVTLDPA